MIYKILPLFVGILVVSNCVNKIILLKSPKGETKECRSTNAMYAGMIGAELEVESCAKEYEKAGYKRF